MGFALPLYKLPDFSDPALVNAPAVTFKPVERNGVAPEEYHGTSVFPEYFKMKDGTWRLLRESRMDCVAVLGPDGELAVTEFRRLKAGELVACGRGENAENGILVHTNAFDFPRQTMEKFAFRTRITRETSFSIDYDELYDLLEYERDHGFIVWVLGPAVTFDHDARSAFSQLIERGFVQGMLAGNALAVHDLEAGIFKTALGQEIYTKQAASLGHYKHLDAINQIRRLGSIDRAMSQGLVQDGIMHALLSRKVPYVLAGSIRDDGPLPEVVANVYEAQDRMRALARKATTVIAMATQLHAIATGNMVPSYVVSTDQTVRPVYFYSVDMSEFAVNKLANRGSLTARSILTNVQDFVVTVERGLRQRGDSDPC
jgi:hypothetical protein